MGGEKGRNDTAWPPGRQYARPEIFFYNPPTFYRQAAAMSGWDIRQARDTYNIAHWGGDYFDINADGHLHVRPRRDGRHPGIDLFRLSEKAQTTRHTQPQHKQISDILHDRVDSLCGAFGEAMRVAGYRGRYTAVYPIKVNQQKSVVQEILCFGVECVGLEAGSKPELMAVLALSRPGGVIICNGYKDCVNIRLALIGRCLSHRVYIVVEKLSELDIIIDEARRLEVMPLLGVRVRLVSFGFGLWLFSGGVLSL